MQRADASINCRPLLCLLIDGPAVDPLTSVRDLRIYIDVDLVMRTHAQQTVSRCFTALRQLRQIRRLVPLSMPQSLVVTGAIKAGLWKRRAGTPSGYLVRRLQSVLNAAARLIYHMRSADHITDALVSLHCLRVPERIEYKIALLT